MANKVKDTYTIKNTSLDKIFEQYKVTDTEELLHLKEDDILDILRDTKTLAYYEATKKTKIGEESYRGIAGPKYKLVPHISIERLIAENTIEIFMPIDYWRADIKALARERDLFDRLDKATTGQETVELMCSIKVGIKIRPGETATTCWTDEFVEEYVKSSPYMKKISLKKIGGEEIKRETPIDEGKTATESNKGVKIEELDYRTLQQMAREKDIPFIGKPKSELVKKLLEIEAKK